MLEEPLSHDEGDCGGERDHSDESGEVAGGRRPIHDADLFLLRLVVVPRRRRDATEHDDGENLNRGITDKLPIDFIAKIIQEEMTIDLRRKLWLVG